MEKGLVVVVPAYNEEEGIEHFHTVLSAELNKLSAYTSSILFVDDGSKDDTFSILKNIAARDRTVSVLKLSRNFGHQAALLAGIDHAEGDVVVTMDADLQHPPAVIPLLLAEYEKGNDVVYTFREEADNLGFFRKFAGALFYRAVNLISDVPIRRNASDFRLMSRRVAELMRERLRERNMFMRGIISWVGFSQSSVRFKADSRFAGSSKYSLSRNIQFAIFGLISFSKKPLRAAAVIGLGCAFFGFAFATVTIVQYFLGFSLEPGWASIVVLLSVFGGIQLFFLGVIGEYIGAIFDEVKSRPQYLVDESVNVAHR